MEKPKYNRPRPDSNGFTDYSEEDKRFVKAWVKYALYKTFPVWGFVVVLFTLYHIAEAQMTDYTLEDIKTPQIEYKWQIDTVDLDALAKAVARHETANCTKGTGVTHNNCFGLMWWPNGERTPIGFKTKQDSYDHFKDLWARKYKGLPDLEKAKKYSGNDRSEAWLRNVLVFYEQETNKLEFDLSS